MTNDTETLTYSLGDIWPTDGHYAVAPEMIDADRAAKDAARATRDALLEATERAGLQEMTADDLKIIRRHSRVVAYRQPTHMDADELESRANAIAARLIASGDDDRPRVAHLKGAVKLAARAISRERMRGLPKVEHSDDPGDYTMLDMDAATPTQRDAVAASIESSYLWPIVRNFPKATKLDAASASAKGAEGTAYRERWLSALRSALETELGADTVDALESAYVPEQRTTRKGKHRAAGTLKASATIRWIDAAPNPAFNDHFRYQVKCAAARAVKVADQAVRVI